MKFKATNPTKRLGGYDLDLVYECEDDERITSTEAATLRLSMLQGQGFKWNGDGVILQDMIKKGFVEIRPVTYKSYSFPPGTALFVTQEGIKERKRLINKMQGFFKK